MNPALLAACLAMASLPPAGLRLGPHAAAPEVAPEASPPADAPTEPPAETGETPPPSDAAPESATPPSTDTPSGDAPATPVDDPDAPVEPLPSGEPARPHAPETAEPAEDPAADPAADPNGPPTPPATVAPTTLPSPGDIELDGDDEPLPDEPYDPTTDRPEALQARHWIRTGAALLVVGGALTITAAVFGGTDPCRRGIGNSCQQAAARRAALAIGIPGALMIAGGATSLAIGIVRRNQLRASVAVGRDSALVGLSGRF
jgi:outer membrane biosynthesis protein TonB